MNTESLTLVRPCLEFAPAYLAYLDARWMAGELPKPVETPAELIQRLSDESRGVGIRAGYVPQSCFWLVKDGSVVVGEGRLRHHLSPWLTREGGHIGYAIHPDYRRRGLGTLILRLMLEKARERGLERVLLTCNTANTASARIIMKNGGVLEGEGISTSTGMMVSRYWIEVPKG